jgi:AraC-like DNA-binding protein
MTMDAKVTSPFSPKHSVLNALAKSAVFQDFKQAFGDATGLPLTLHPLESWQVPHRGNRHESPFCALMAGQSRSCAHCLQVQQRLSESATIGPCTITCGAGMSESAVPVRLGEKVIGLIQTGQAFLAEPTLAQFDRTAKMISEWGVEVDVEQLKDAYYATPVMSPGRYASTVDLLAVFSQHLSIIAQQMQVQEETAEPPLITRAKQFILDHYTEDLGLAQVAKSVNMSMFYFCKLFKRMTGLNFTEYLAQVRIEKAKNLLLNPNLHVSEIAYEVGFQSLTHFNRVFKKLVGQAPTAYRDRLTVRQARAA